MLVPSFRISGSRASPFPRCLIAVKTLHWLYNDRVNFMETSPVITWKYRIRMITLTGFLIAIDSILLYYSYEMFMKKKILFLVFMCEYGLLFIKANHIFIRFLLHSIDLASSSPWENKNMYMMYIKVAVSLCRVVIYASFVYYLTINTHFPLYQLRPVMVEFRQLKNTIRDIFRSKKAIEKMKLFPDATAADFTADTDVTCIICHEDMVCEVDGPVPETTPAASGDQDGAENVTPPERPKIKKLLGEIKKLPCKHMFHTGCLRSWLLRQQTCPICRSSILTASTPNAATPNAAAAAGGVNNIFRRNVINRNANNNDRNARADAQRIQNIIQNLRDNNLVPANVNFRVRGQVIRPPQAQGQGQNAAAPNAGAQPNANIPVDANGNDIQAIFNQALNRAANNDTHTPITSSTSNTRVTPSSELGDNTLKSIQKLLEKSTKNENFANIVSQASKTIPIPKIPLDLADLMKLDEEELHEMESTEKLAVAKRVKHLRNIRTMCDASIAMMTQYEGLDLPEMQQDREKENKSSRKNSKNLLDFEKLHELLSKTQSDLPNSISSNISKTQNFEELLNKKNEDLKNEIEASKKRIAQALQSGDQEATQPVKLDQKEQDKETEVTQPIKEESTVQETETSIGQEEDMTKFEREQRPVPSLNPIPAPVKEETPEDSPLNESQNVEENILEAQGEVDQDDSEEEAEPTIAELRRRRVQALSQNSTSN